MKLKKTYSIIFIVIFCAMLGLPFVFADRSGDNVSEEENRTLAERASVIQEGKVNLNFPSDYEEWLSDHLGFRSTLINLNAWQSYYVFGQFPDSSDTKIGKTGDLNYATDAIIKDYQHINLRTEEEVARIGDSYQVISDWVQAQGIQFYYVQCVDKQTICPEQFIAGVEQLGDVTKTDQVMEYIADQTTVNAYYMKDLMLEKKKDYEVYSEWGDPTHWTQRGAYFGYLSIMEMINENNDNQYRVLSEEDYDITIIDQGKTYYDKIHKVNMSENFTIKNPSAIKQEDKSPMGQFADYYRHNWWYNPDSGNETKLLVMGDSYINSFIIDDLAESFSETWMIWGDYTEQLPEVIELYHPDIIIYECAERVDRSNRVCNLAQSIAEGT